MPSRDVNAATRLAGASLRRDKKINVETMDAYQFPFVNSQG